MSGVLGHAGPYGRIQLEEFLMSDLVIIKTTTGGTQAVHPKIVRRIVGRYSENGEPAKATLYLEKVSPWEEWSDLVINTTMTLEEALEKFADG